MWISSMKDEREKLKLEKNKLNSEITELEQIKQNLQTEINDFIKQKEKLEFNIRNKQKFFVEHELIAIDTMSGIQFEEYFINILNKIGYVAHGTKASNDEGADILAEKDNIKYVFQCKNYSNSVGNKAVQEVYSAKGIYNCDKAIVITNNYYTKQAIKEAEILSIILWDRDVLEKILYQAYEFDLENTNYEKIKRSKSDTNEGLFSSSSYDENFDDTDPFLMDAIDAVVDMGQASASFIQ